MSSQPQFSNSNQETQPFKIMFAENQVSVQVYFADPFTTDMPGSGNPAAVVILEPDADLSIAQRAYIASYLAQPETIFASCTSPGEWLVDWYTPAGTQICPGGNSTIALAKVILSQLQPGLSSLTLRSHFPGLDSIAFMNDDGQVTVSIPAVSARVVFPAYRNRLIEAIGDGPTKFLAGQQDLIAVYENEDQVRSIVPKLWFLDELNYSALIATAKGDRGGFVYRTFIAAGQSGWECPGSARALMNLVPFWHTQLAQFAEAIAVEQLSARGGAAVCRLVSVDDLGDQVLVTSQCQIRSGPSTFTFPSMDGEVSQSNQGPLRPSDWI